MKRVLLPLLYLFTSTACAQEVPVMSEHVQDSIVAEARLLYRSEMTSWYGTDAFMEKFKERERLGGYLSYADKDLNKCIFFGKGQEPKVLGTVILNASFSVPDALVNIEERALTPQEKALYTIRQRALESMRGDTMFRFYENVNYNPIPLIVDGAKRVYLLFGPTQQGVVLIGNDYLFTFNGQNEILSKKPLHKSLLTLPYNEASKGQVVSHTHLAGMDDLITATDICTSMLYGKFAKWSQHTVISRNWLSIWDCEKEQLVVLSKEAMQKIADHQRQKNKSE